ncbi:U6 snRNA-associated Sm-like protein LSm7 [Nilaparvata lugens]|uniref:U6 snRNA-associated Sm-like protein LSm7 n=1 Tax=Nilaparvata lugens TaxID=108931 RepID=UPI00193E4690|nr:U6 snRNA-associated Sm-like protein LSm7 [Nilaparvata lugens]
MKEIFEFGVDVAIANSDASKSSQRTNTIQPLHHTHARPRAHARTVRLKGYDPLLNLVLDDTTEFLRDPDDPYKLTEDTRMLGLVVCRGTSVVLICPVDGMESIPNPFVPQDS